MRATGRDAKVAQMRRLSGQVVFEVVFKQSFLLSAIMEDVKDKMGLAMAALAPLTPSANKMMVTLRRTTAILPPCS